MTESFRNEFKREVLEGLTAEQKFLPSKYFYDERGDKLFQDIMHMPEYYLTDCEYSVFEGHKTAILEAFRFGDEPFELVEFGAGDGKKTKVLLRYFVEQGVNFSYRPVDISPNIIEYLTDNLKTELPDLKVEALALDYFKALEYLNEHSKLPKVLMFLGSNVGNFRPSVRAEVLQGIANHLQPGDKFLMGVDIKKHPDKILSAYNDKAGITAAFNFNILHRINETFNANFDLDKFFHYPNYDPLSGEARSYLVAKEAMNVEIEESIIEFEPFEPIHTEISKKFSEKEINNMARTFGFSVLNHFYDEHRFFLDTLWKKV